jgi:hypothetical protein
MIKHGNMQIHALINGPSARKRPLGSFVLPLSPGVTALYGLNGAGKSLVLESLKEVLSGIRGERTNALSPMLYVQPDSDSVDMSDDVSDLWVCGKAAGLYEELSPRGDSLEDLASWSTPEEKFPVWGALSKWRDFTTEQYEFNGGFFEDADIDQVLIEFLRQKRFLVRATGFESMAEWAIDLALVREPGVVEAVPYLDLCDQGIWKVDGVGELAIWMAAQPMGDARDLHDFWPSLYRLETWSEWRIADPRIRVMGSSDFDPDAATLKTLASYERHAFTHLVDQANEGDGIDQSGSLFAAALMAARGGVPGLEPLEQSEWLVLDGGALSDGCGIQWLSRFLSLRASNYFSRLLPDAPLLRLEIWDPKEWATGRTPKWGILGDEWVPFEVLSTAERRWATLSIELALAPQRGGFLVLDEPELALHRSAERFMATGLASIAEEMELAVVVATHSPEVLDDPRTNVYLVRRSDQGLLHDQQVHKFVESSKVDLREFGLLPSDLLRRQKGFLFVEGQHDLIILKELIGEELEQMRVEILPVRGAGKLASALDSRVLYDFTSAHMFVLLDALRASEIHQIWIEAVRLSKTDSQGAAISYADENLRKLKVDEANALAAFLTRAIERGLEARHTPLGLSRPDVLDYLPVDAFVKDAGSWDDLRDELDRSAGSPQSGSKFKSWLTSAKKADLSLEHISEVSKQLDAIPEDFLFVLSTVSETVIQKHHP